MKKCKIYNVTDSDYFFVDCPAIRYERDFRSGYYEAYRLVRNAYKNGKTLQLFVLRECKEHAMISSYPDLGILITSNSKCTWAKEI